MLALERNLLVGRLDQLASANPPDSSELNVADPSNLWVSIVGQKGPDHDEREQRSAPRRGPVEAAGAARDFATS